MTKPGGFLNHDEALAYAHKRNRDLYASDFDGRQRVIVEHEDGSVFSYTYAFAEVDGDWLMVFSEHHDPAVFRLSGLKSWKTGMR